MNTPPLVLYHDNCADGFCAAWLFSKVFPGADFMPVQYGQQPPDVTGREVYIVDFSYKRGPLLQMAEQAARIVVLDHHKTAAKELEGIEQNERLQITFDMEKSGGRLAWEYLQGIRGAGPFFFQNRPWLVDYTEDRDLWRWKKPYSKEVNAVLRSYPMDLKTWDRLNCYEAKHFVSEGEAILRAQAIVVGQHVRNAHEIELDGHKVLCVNATCFQSEIGNELCKGRPFSVTWFEGDDNERVYSLRSDESGIDVSKIAEAHGGGGHRHAAGFRAPATGATGTFSQGQLNEEDEGDLRIAIATDTRSGVVRVDFGKAVAWLGLPKREAQQIASLMLQKANEL